jgi:CBS domain-containing protein
MTPEPNISKVRVSDVMHPGVVSCASQTPLAQVAQLMADNDVHAVFVDGMTPQLHAHERLVEAFVTDQDLMRAIGAGRVYAEAGQTTTSHVTAVHADDPLQRAAELMGREGCSHLIVLSRDGLEPLGVISSLDIARALSRPPDS